MLGLLDCPYPRDPGDHMTQLWANADGLVTHQLGGTVTQRPDGQIDAAIFWKPVDRALRYIFAADQDLG